MLYQKTIRFAKPIQTVVLVDPKAPVGKVPPAKAPEPLSPPVSRPPQPVAPPPPTITPAERQQLEEVMGRLMDLGQTLHEQQRQRLQEMQEVAVELAVAIASRLIHENIDRGAFGVDAMIRQVVAQLESEHPVTVYLHPNDLALLHKRLGDAKLMTANHTEVRLAADATLKRGDCRAETGDVHLLSQLEDHLVEIRKGLLHNLPIAEVERRNGSISGLKRFPDRRQTA